MTAPDRLQMESIASAGILAPSADNRHTCQFEFAAGGIRLWEADECRQAPFHRRILAMISYGAMAENMCVFARSLGFHTHVSWFPHAADRRLVCVLSFERDHAGSDGLAAEIPKRCTNRRFFRGPKMPAEEQRAFDAELVNLPRVRLIWLDDSGPRHRALRLIRIAEAERFSNRCLHQDLFASIRFDLDWQTTASEGLAPGSLEVEWLLRNAFRSLRHWSVMRALKLAGAHWLLSLRAAELPSRFSPHLGLLATTSDLEHGTFEIGRALERIWLRATALGLAFQPLAASTLLALDGYEEVTQEVRVTLAEGWRKIAPGCLPLMVFRAGRSRPPRVRSGRLELERYLVKET